MFEGPPSLKSIFIFAVLTFSSSSQRHNEGFLQLPWPASVTVYADKTRLKQKTLFISIFLSERVFHAKKIVIIFLGHNTAVNVHDHFGLNLERKCFVLQWNKPFKRVYVWSFVTQMDHRVVCSLAEVCSLLVNMRPCSETAVTEALVVCRHSHQNFYFPGQECDIQWSLVRLKCVQLNN